MLLNAPSLIIEAKRTDKYLKKRRKSCRKLIVIGINVVVFDLHYNIFGKTSIYSFKKQTI